MSTPKPHSGAKALSSPPLTSDQLLARDSVEIHRHLPKALATLKSSHSISLIGEPRDFQPENALHKVDTGGGAAAYQLRADVKLVRGLLGKDGERLSREEIKAAAASVPSLAPYQPEWAKTVTPPIASLPPTRPALRRINGKRVQPLFVFGNDDRQPYYPSGFPNQCIGKIYAWTNPSNPYPDWSGTGTLVGPNLVLTAGHVAPWGSSPWMMQFIPAYYNGASILGASVYSYVESYRGGDGSNVAWDRALLKLYDPLGASLGWMGTKSYSDSWNDSGYWTLAGYPGAIANAEQPSWQGGISFHDDDEDGDAMELESDNADASPGDSGGPLYAFWDDGPHIVGVLSASESEYQFPFSSEDNSVAAAGNAMVDLVKWGYANWPV